MTKGRLLLVSLAIVQTVASVAQAPSSTEVSRGINPLEVSMQNLLAKPFVQTEIGLTDRQVVELQTRIMMTPMRHLPDFIEMLRKSADGSEQEAHFNFNSDTMPKLALSDLNASQRDRLKQLAIQLDPVAAMQSKEVAEALQLDANQVGKIEHISKEYMARANEEASLNQGLSSPAFERLGDAARKLKNMDLDKDAKASAKKQFADALTELEKVFAEYFFEANYKIDRIKKEFAPKVLEVLTPAQRARYKKLCGKIVKG